MFYPLGHRSSLLARVPVVLMALLLIAAALFTYLLEPGTTLAGFDPDKEGTITAPEGEGSPAVDWSGLVPPGTGSAAVCVDGVNAYFYTLHLTGIDAEYYTTHEAQLHIRVLWDPTPPSPDATTQDLALYVNYEGTQVATSDGGSNQEFVVINNPAAGDYQIIVCDFLTLLPQEFNALASLNVSAVEPGGGDTVPDPEDGDRDLLFSPTTVVDPQRDVAEPSLRIDPKWNIYACGPFGASRAAEYAQKSEDEGDTFRVLGQPPEGRISPGGGGDCELAVGTVPLSDTGEYNLAYTGLEALVNFSTGRSTNAGLNFIGQNVAVIDAGLDRQWMEGIGQQTVYLGYNEVAQGYRVARSEDGGFTYGLPVTAAEDIFRPGPIRIDPDPTHNPVAANETVYFTFTRADSVWVSRSYDRGATWEEFMVAEGFNPNNLFSALAIDTAGNLYSAWTEKGSFNTYYAYSLRPSAGAGGAGETWSEKRLVNRMPVLSSVMPWIEAGDPGRISVTYYGSPSDGNIEVAGFNGYWHIYVSTSFNALDDVDTNGNVPFALTQATTHPVHFDSICVSGLGCTLINGDRTLLDFFQNRLDPDGHIHVVFNQSNKVPGAAAGRIAIVTYVKQIAGPSLYAAVDAGDANRGEVGPAYPDPRPVVRDSSADRTGDAQFPFSQFGPQPPARINMEALDVNGLSITPSCMTGLEAGAFDIDLNLGDISDAALAEALVTQTTTGSPASSLLWVVRWFSGTDPYSAVAKWSPAEGFTFGFNALRLDTSTGRLEVYPGDQPIVSGARVNNTTIRMTVQPSMFQSLVLPKQPDGDPIIRAAVVGDRIYDVTAFTFGNQSPVPEEQTYLNQGDSTAPFDHVLQPTTPEFCAPTVVTVGTPTVAPVSNDWLPLVAALGALVVVGGLALARRRSR